MYFFFFWTGEPCNEIIRTKRSDFKEKILNKGVKNILIYTIILKNHIHWEIKTSSQGCELFYFDFSGQVSRPSIPSVLHEWSKDLPCV